MRKEEQKNETKEILCRDSSVQGKKDNFKNIGAGEMHWNLRATGRKKEDENNKEIRSIHQIVL